jgi:hypothetical protein
MTDVLDDGPLALQQWRDAQAAVMRREAYHLVIKMEKETKAMMSAARAQAREMRSEAKKIELGHTGYGYDY